MFDSRTRSVLSACRLSFALMALGCGSACVSAFELDLPPDHPSVAEAPGGGALPIPDPAGIPEQVEPGTPEEGGASGAEMRKMGHDAAAGEGRAPREPR